MGRAGNGVVPRVYGGVGVVLDGATNGDEDLELVGAAVDSAGREGRGEGGREVRKGW